MFHVEILFHINVTRQIYHHKFSAISLLSLEQLFKEITEDFPDVVYFASVTSPDGFFQLYLSPLWYQ
jgi:hypothetical protein